MVWSDDGRVECDHCHRVYRGRVWRKAEFRGTGVVWCNRINQVNRVFCSFCLLTQDRVCVTHWLEVGTVLFRFFFSVIPCLSSLAGRWLRRADNMPVSGMVNRSFDCPGRV